MRGTVALSPVLEPVAHLRQRQTSLFSKCSLLVRCGVAILFIAFLQRLSRFLLETINCFFTVPDSLWERVLPTYSVLINCAQRSPSDFLGLHVVRLVPHLLQHVVIGAVEGVTLHDGVQFSEVATVEGDGSARLEHRLAAAEQLVRRQRPQEARQSVNVPALR